MLRFDVITLFPEMFAGVLDRSILKRAAASIPDPASPDDPTRVRPPVASYHLHQLRDFSADARHRKVDKPPFGGGPGMVLQCQPLWDAVRHVESIEPDTKPRRVLLTPTGRSFTQRVAEELAATPRLLLICGHYEGFDQRALDALHDEAPEGGDGLDEISVGDFVLSGGELPAMTLIDAVVRLIPGALGDADSAHHDSFSPGVKRLLDHPHYTQPAEWEGRAVPGVLRSGDHAAVAAWREAQSRRLTEARRPDLLTGTTTVPLPIATIREAAPSETEAIARVHTEAFGDGGCTEPQEADISRALRAANLDVISVVADLNGDVVGHAVISEAHLQEEPAVRGLLALGPIAVRPPYQGRGLGQALMRECVRQAKQAGAARLFLLGNPAFYTRFGFEAANDSGFSSKWGDGPEFMVLNLRPNKAINTGMVVFADAFD